LLGIELINTLKTHLTEDEIHMEVVLLVAPIAIGHKVGILRPSQSLRKPVLINFLAFLKKRYSGWKSRKR